jgi:hypothetical protein
MANLKYLQSMKNPILDYSTDEESKYFGNKSYFSKDDEDMSMVKSSDYKLQTRNASAIMSQSLKTENKWPARSYWSIQLSKKNLFLAITL